MKATIQAKYVNIYGKPEMQMVGTSLLGYIMQGTLVDLGPTPVIQTLASLNYASKSVDWLQITLAPDAKIYQMTGGNDPRTGDSLFAGPYPPLQLKVWLPRNLSGVDPVREIVPPVQLPPQIIHVQDPPLALAIGVGIAGVLGAAGLAYAARDTSAVAMAGASRRRRR